MKKTYLGRECLSLKLSDVKDSALWRVRGKEINTKETVRTKVLRQDRCHGPEIEFNRGCLKWRRGFCGGSDGKESAAMQETQIQSLGGEDSLELEMATCSRILAWKIPWTEGLPSMGSQRVWYSWVTERTHTHRKDQWSPGREEEKTRSRKGEGRIFSTLFFSHVS